MKPQLTKLLIANRGEIACRIIRSARIFGLKTVAVYSAADANSTHVAAADESMLIGPAEASKSYLDIAAILNAARQTGADAIHPGYGFLSERPEFARAAAEAGIIFVGPHPDVMAALGDKVAARRIAIEAGVPVVPGIETAELSAARDFADRVSYPILVKAAAGGGGRGMRIVHEAAQLEASLEAAAREALAAFGDGRLFVEKYLAHPRHVEIQILGDEHGNVVALGERECSIQRRYQKIIEESPSPGISEQTRAAMIDAALRLARASRYSNAGTIEFLVEGANFYFLEVNARLQVEHPITEERFGIDLVCEQLRIASGGNVAAPPAPRGAAIECRLNAEDPEHDFRPATGTVLHLRVPAGPGVRFDSHLAPGAVISPYYDGLLGKLVCFGADREEARRRMLAALNDFELLGVANNASFLRDIVASEPFRSADLSTHFVDEHFSSWHPCEADVIAGLLAAAITAERDHAGAAPNANGDRAAATNRSPWAELRGFELWRSRA
ncbi:MAG: biotin carboxylase N-terminal domain-containing protein [Candidatus Binatus sp.]|uniref:acetyl-CoA carboxylase biotin carboxylase subunit n=1 Tax=Candidatus Binatus sp. TaxID=2811406 RepID=UPI00271DEC1B|nr:biotin carboxylase N-terminal domain-containing protein [Candidatus Binatus sp.]MDO8432343.1 biotin carboxylase N-terminal domain-containing protein [Candidatus Binatus sp.]